jgi:hypothetical protein
LFCIAATAPFCTSAREDIDSCRIQLPADIVVAVAKVFPGFRAPLESDNSTDDIEMAKAANGSGCNGVAKGQFQVRGRQDFALALTSMNGESGKVVVASSVDGQWKFEVLATWPSYRSNLFVVAGKPGKFERRIESAGPSNKPDERESMNCETDSVVFGKTESSASEYCHLDGHWISVLFSN